MINKMPDNTHVKKYIRSQMHSLGRHVLFIVCLDNSINMTTNEATKDAHIMVIPFHDVMSKM